MPKIVLRSIVVGAILVVLIAGYLWLVNRPTDMPIVDIPAVDSRGYIVALMETEGGTRLVSINPDGEIREVEGGEDVDDREIAWKPDGRRVIFISNRTPGGSYQVFEWKPDRRNRPFMLTQAGASRRNPWFHPSGELITFSSQGDVLSLTYPQRRARRVMPPSVGPVMGSEEEHAHEHEQGDHRHDAVAETWTRISQMMEGEAFYNGFVDTTGTRFVGIYETALGRALVLQMLDPQTEHEIGAIVPMAGERIEMSLSADKAAVSLVNFRYPFPQAIPPDRIRPDGTVEREFVNAVVVIDLAKMKIIPVFLSPAAEEDFVFPALSNDAERIALVYRRREDDMMRTQGLVVAPATEGGIAGARPVTSGPVSEPSWSPDGEMIAFVRDGDIWTIRADGSQERNITQGRGRFRSPLFSPMQ